MEGRPAPFGTLFGVSASKRAKHLVKSRKRGLSEAPRMGGSLRSYVYNTKHRLPVPLDCTSRKPVGR